MSSDHFQPAHAMGGTLSAPNGPARYEPRAYVDQVAGCYRAVHRRPHRQVQPQSGGACCHGWQVFGPLRAAKSDAEADAARLSRAFASNGPDGVHSANREAFAPIAALSAMHSCELEVITMGDGRRRARAWCVSSPGGPTFVGPLRRGHRLAEKDLDAITAAFETGGASQALEAAKGLWPDRQAGPSRSRSRRSSADTVL